MRAPALLALALLAGCGSVGNPVAHNGPLLDTYVTNDPSVVTVLAGNGGPVAWVFDRYEQWAAEGRTLVIDGPVASADGFAAFSYPGPWCYTARARLMLHAVSDMHWRRVADTTDRLTNRLPAPVAAAFRADPHYREIKGTTDWGADVLDHLIPEKRCRRQA